MFSFLKNTLNRVSFLIKYTSNTSRKYCMENEVIINEGQNK